ncbi:TolC family protein [Pseudarcicella hirudinis]|uniref:TolC family protein n=1 Tax=Pseudarcicella hirudinis TaxID=1079859 RepID=UPI0035E52D0B
MNLKSAKLSLSQLMNLNDDEELLLERIEAVETPSANPDIVSKDIFSLAKEIRPEVKAAEMRIKSAEISREIAKGSKYPVVTLNFGLGTQYSSAAPGERFVKDGSVTYIEKPSDDAYVLTNGVKSPVYIKQAIEGGEMQKFKYFDQLGTNFNRGIVLNIKIPIFNGYSARNRIAKSVIEKKQAECQAENVKQQLRQNIEQAYNNYNASLQKVSALENQVRSLEEAFRVAEYSFNLGKISSVDYNLAKTQLDKARYNRIQAKYERVFRLKILSFYQNNTDF